jgi:hypothetical protein
MRTLLGSLGCWIFVVAWGLMRLLGFLWVAGIAIVDVVAMCGCRGNWVARIARVAEIVGVALVAGVRQDSQVDVAGVNRVAEGGWWMSAMSVTTGQCRSIRRSC